MNKIATLAVVGVGLIGGSFAAAVRRAGLAGRILGVGRHADTLRRAQALGLIDGMATLEEAAAQADLILLAVPVEQTAACLARMAPYLRDTALVTDAGSTKAGVAQAARTALQGRAGQFVPGHPIAGSHESGPEAARADLYDGRRVLITPIPENRPDDVARLQAIWEACGARVDCLDVERHDALLASVSHFPHWLAMVYINQILGADDAQARFDMAGTGFRDFTRIAAASPEMWRDISLQNAPALLDEIRAWQAAFDVAAQALEQRDGEALLALFERASQARQQWGRKEETKQ
ncbi:MAG: prephenate dehydrogenase/arogenate dehydrogenase family protein [Corticimicrobacter sp.]|uniref:prephenate dehydrogenase n=1 Tax=Corticimicrobacter sp. TaxID=2678536 RepID=UPI0032DA4F1F